MKLCNLIVSSPSLLIALSLLPHSARPSARCNIAIRLKFQVKDARSRQPGAGTCLGKRALLMRCAPRLAIGTIKYAGIACAARCEFVEQRAPFVRQYDVMDFPGLRLAHSHRASIGIRLS
jgi:hypothetical protein